MTRRDTPKKRNKDLDLIIYIAMGAFALLLFCTFARAETTFDWDGHKGSFHTTFPKPLVDYGNGNQTFESATSFSEDANTKEVTINYGTHWIKVKPHIYINNNEKDIKTYGWVTSIMRGDYSIELSYVWSKTLTSKTDVEFEVTSDLDLTNEEPYVYKTQYISLNLNWLALNNINMSKTDISSKVKKLKTVNDVSTLNYIDPTFTDTSQANFNLGTYRNLIGNSDGTVNLTGTNTTGIYFSQFFDSLNPTSNWKTMNWTASIPANTNISFSYRVLSPYTADANTLALWHFDNGGATNMTADYCNPVVTGGCAILNNTGSSSVIGVFGNATAVSATSVIIYNISGMPGQIGTIDYWALDDWASEASDGLVYSTWDSITGLSNSSEARYRGVTRTIQTDTGSTGWTIMAYVDEWRDNEWHHFCQEYNRTSGFVSQYVDGNLIGSIGSIVIDVNGGVFTTGKLRLGNRVSGANAIASTIDELRIQNNTRCTDISPSFKPFNTNVARNESTTTGVMRLDTNGNDINGKAPNKETNTVYSTIGTRTGVRLNSTTQSLWYDVTTYLPNLNKGTIEFWYAPSQPAGFNTGALTYFLNYWSNLSESNSSIHVYKWTTNVWYFDIRNSIGGTNSIVCGAEDWKQNEWHHIALAWDNTSSTRSMACYVDGMLRNYQSSTFKMIGNTGGQTNFSIGGGGYAAASHTYNTYTAQAYFDDIRISNYAKTQNELAYYEGSVPAQQLTTSLASLNTGNREYFQYRAYWYRATSATATPTLNDTTIDFDNQLPPVITNNVLNYTGTILKTGQTFNMFSNVYDWDGISKVVFTTNVSGVLTNYTGSLLSGTTYYNSSAVAGAVGNYQWMVWANSTVGLSANTSWINFYVESGSESWWDVALIIVLGGAALIFCFLFAFIDTEHSAIKLLFFLLALVFVIIMSSIMSNLPSIAGVTSTVYSDRIVQVYSSMIWVLYLTIAYFVLYFVSKTFAYMISLSQNKKQQRERDKYDE